MTDNQDKMPTLLMMLEYNKFQDLLKAMVSKKISTLLLQEYGEQESNFSVAE